jgi:hypothetical protein
MCLHTQNLNQDPLENIFGAIRSYCALNNNPTVGQFIDAQKTTISNGLAFRGLWGTNCEDDGTSLLDNLQSLLREPDTSLPNPSTSRCKEKHVPASFHVAQQVQNDIHAAVHADDMEVFSVAYVSGSFARQVHHGVSCNSCKTCLTLKCCYKPMSSYISRSKVIQISLSPILLRS